MTVRGRAWLAIAAVVAGSISAMRALGQNDRQSGVTAKLSLLDMTGRVVGRANHDEPVRLRVELTDAITGRAPRGLELSGWIRSVDRFGRSCEDEARAFRVTRSIAEGAIDLNGAVFAVLTEDGNLGVIEPKLDGQPANMIAAAALPRVPDDFLVDRVGMRAIAVFRDEGSVEGISLATGRQRSWELAIDNLPLRWRPRLGGFGSPRMAAAN